MIILNQSFINCNKTILILRQLIKDQGFISTILHDHPSGKTHYCDYEHEEIFMNGVLSQLQQTKDTCDV